MPGGLGEMIALSEQMGGDVRSVSLVHAARHACIVFAIPAIATLLGLAPPSGVVADGETLGAWSFLLLVACAIGGYLIAHRVRMPAASFIGPMLGSATVHLVGWVEAAPPYLLLAVAQLVIGSAVGARFAGVPLAMIRTALLLGAGATVLMLTIALAFAAVLHGLTDHALLLLLLAFIPGGFAEMSLIALALGVDAAFVVTHHSVRVFLVVLIALPAFLLL